MTKIAASLTVIACFASTFALGQDAFDRLPENIFNITAPSARVSGSPGTMRILETSCQVAPVDNARRRIVDTAVQEWAYFGFSVLEQTQFQRPPPVPGTRRTYARLSEEESARLADSIAGYWSASTQGSWILAEQNSIWNGPRGIASRWRYPWSAAFISWVMCESGLGESEVFERAIAHHSYIDQAIIARQEEDSTTAYVAFDPGEEEILPGDMLCRGSRPAYKSIAQRLEQLGVGARTHCDIVVKVNADAAQILTIGGNVRASVRLKVFEASISAAGHLSPDPNARRPIFAHLKLNAQPIAPDAMNSTPTMRALACSNFTLPAQVSTLESTASASNC